MQSQLESLLLDKPLQILSQHVWLEMYKENMKSLPVALLAVATNHRSLTEYFRPRNLLTQDTQDSKSVGPKCTDTLDLNPNCLLDILELGSMCTKTLDQKPQDTLDLTISKPNCWTEIYSVLF